MANSGLWVPVDRAAAEIGVCIETFHRWRRENFCHPLGKKARFREGRGRQFCIHRDDFLAIQQRGTTDIANGAWIPIEEAACELGVSAQTIRHWEYRGHCAVLDRKPRIEKRRRKSGYGFHKLLHIHRDDVQQIRERMLKADADDEWIPIEQAALTLKLNAKLLRKWHHRKHCPPLGRPAKFRTLKRRNSRSVVRAQICIHRDEIEALQSGERSAEREPEWMPIKSAASAMGVPHPRLFAWYQKGHCAPLGRPARFKSRRTLDTRGRVLKQVCIHRDDKSAIQQLALTDESTDWVPITEAAPQIGVSRSALQSWHAKQWCPRLGRNIAVEKRRMKDKSGAFSRQLCIHENDLQQLRSLTKGFESAELFTLEEAAKIIGCDYGAKRLSLVIGGWRPNDPLSGVFSHRKRPGVYRDGRRRSNMLAVTQAELDEALRRLNGEPASATDSTRAGNQENGTVVVQTPPMPPRRRGRPKQTERDAWIRCRAKEESLMDAPAELTKRLNADQDFVAHFGTVEKGAVRGVLDRMKKRPQKP